MAIWIFSKYKTLQIVTQQRWLSNLRDFTFLISLSLSQIDQESWDETIWESVHKLLNGHNVSNHSIAGPSSHDFCFPWHNALPAIDRQSKPAGDDGAGWKSHEVLVATPSLPTDKLLCGHSVTCFGGAFGVQRWELKNACNSTRLNWKEHHLQCKPHVKPGEKETHQGHWQQLR